MTKYTTIVVKKSTRDKLSHIKNKYGMSTYEEVIDIMLKKQYPTVMKYLKKFMGIKEEDEDNEF